MRCLRKEDGKKRRTVGQAGRHGEDGKDFANGEKKKTLVRKGPSGEEVGANAEGPKVGDFEKRLRTSTDVKGRESATEKEGLGKKLRKRLLSTR